MKTLFLHKTNYFCPMVKFMFSKKTTKMDEIFTINLTLCSKCQIGIEDLLIFVAFLENTNFIVGRNSDNNFVGFGEKRCLHQIISVFTDL